MCLSLRPSCVDVCLAVLIPVPSEGEARGQGRCPAGRAKLRDGAEQPSASVPAHAGPRKAGAS